MTVIIVAILNSFELSLLFVCGEKRKKG